MSAAVNVAIADALRGNSALVALLATDTDLVDVDGNPTSGPAIYYARKSETPPLYDQVTILEETLDPANLYAPTWNEDEEYYQVTAWTNKRGSGVLDGIRRQIDISLNKQILPAADPTQAKIRYVRRVGGSSRSLYDPIAKAWFWMLRYRAWVASV